MSLHPDLRSPHPDSLLIFLMDPTNFPASLQAGKVMQGLSVLKDKPDPVALPDDQYPAWLWTILDEAPKTSPEGEFDFLTERRRLRAK